MIAALVLAVFLSGGTAVAADEVKIGVMQALTGDLGTYGQPMTDGILLAVKEVNENGGVLGGLLRPSSRTHRRRKCHLWTQQTSSLRWTEYPSRDHRCNRQRIEHGNH